MEIEIRIDKGEALVDAQRRAEYIGAKDADPESYARLMATEADGEVFDAFWAEAKTAMAQVLGRVLAGMAEEGGALEARLKVSERLGAGMRGVIEDGLKSYLRLAMLAKWLEMAGMAERAAGYATAAAGVLDGAKAAAMSKEIV